MSRSATAHFGMNEIRCITVDVEAHIASVEPDDGVRLGGCVVHNHLRFLDVVGGGLSLIGANFVECDEHGGVEGAIDVEKVADDALHARDAAFIKFRCGRGVGILLHLGPIHSCDPFVVRVLMARRYGVLEVLQVFAEGVGHGYVDVVFQVVPIYGKSAVLSSRWVDGDGVILPECI